MGASAIRNWLGAYVLFLTAFVGAYFFIAPPALLPLEQADRISATEIILPFLLAQVAVVFRFFSTARPARPRMVDIPAWLVKAPPLLVSAILLVEFTLMAVGGLSQRADIVPPPEGFKGLLTFCVALLNSSMVFVVTRYFEAASTQLGEAQSPLAMLDHSGRSPHEEDPVVSDPVGRQ